MGVTDLSAHYPFARFDAAARERVRAANFEYIRASGTTSVEANVMYAVARKE